MIKEEIDNHFSNAWQYENQNNFRDAYTEYVLGVNKLNTYCGQASPEEVPALRSLRINHYLVVFYKNFCLIIFFLKFC